MSGVKKQKSNGMRQAACMEKSFIACFSRLWKRRIMLSCFLTIITATLTCCKSAEVGILNHTSESSDARTEVTLISNEENTDFRVKEGNAPQFQELGVGKILKVKLSSTGPLVICAKPPGYDEIVYTLSSPNAEIEFFYLEGMKRLTIRSDHENTRYRIRRTGDSRWLDIGETGTNIEFKVPHEGSFEIEATAPGCFPEIEPVIDPTGELIFSDFVYSKIIELVSNRDFTRFFIRKLGEGDADWEYLGVGRSITSSVPTTGAFEISAQPVDYRTEIKTLMAPQEILSFEFNDAPRTNVLPATPASFRQNIIPRPAPPAEKLPVEAQNEITNGESR